MLYRLVEGTFIVIGEGCCAASEPHLHRETSQYKYMYVDSRVASRRSSKELARFTEHGHGHGHGAHARVRYVKDSYCSHSYFPRVVPRAESRR